MKGMSCSPLAMSDICGDVRRLNRDQRNCVVESYSAPGAAI
jgi:hypothetical protein